MNNICGLEIGERVCIVEGPHDSNKHMMAKKEFVYVEENQPEYDGVILNLLTGFWYVFLIGITIACVIGAYRIAGQTP